MSSIICDHQFIIQHKYAPPLNNHITTKLGCHYVSYDKRFTCIKIKNNHLRECALIIGYIYINGKHHFEGQHDNASIRVNSIEDIEKEILPTLAGSFILITFGSLPNRLYLDHGGSIPAVYDKENGRVATTAALLLNESKYKNRFRHNLHRELIINEQAGGWISGTLTAHHNIFRLLPNFFLDLATLQQHRHWPVKPDNTKWINISQAVTSINTSLAQFTHAAINSFHAAHTLTAGYDSRLLLSACSAIKKDCHLFTLNAPGASTDILVANQIATRFDLSHQYLEIINSTQKEQEQWDKMVGHCVKEVNRETFQTLPSLIQSNFIITGMYGEIGRCRLYRQDYMNVNTLPINEEIILSRLTLPQNKELRQDIKCWLSTLAGHCNSVIFDLAFLELKFGSWAMGQNPIQNSLKFGLLPFAQRNVLESFIRVNPKEKTTQALFDKCIKTAWPTLATIPINSAGLIKDIQYKIRKIISPTRIKRVLRDRLARYR